MASIALAFTHPAVGTIQSTRSIADQAGARIVDAYRTMYGQVDDGAGGMREMTSQEVVDRIMDDMFMAIRSNVRAHELQQAMIAAEGSVQEIEGTKV